MSVWGAAEDARLAMRMLGISFKPLEESPLPSLHVSAMEVSSGLDNSTADESAEDMQAPSQGMAADVAADVATAADRHFAMLDAPLIDAPILGQRTASEPVAEQWAIQAMASEAPTDGSVEPTDSSSQADNLSHAEPDGASGAAEEQAASSGVAMGSFASPDVGWSGVDSWVAVAAAVGGQFAAPESAAVAGGPLGVRQQSTAAALQPTGDAAAETTTDTSLSSSGEEVGTIAEVAGMRVSAESNQSSNGAEQESVAGDPFANGTAAADLFADSSQSGSAVQSRTDDVEAAGRTSSGNLPSSSSANRSTADSTPANAAAAAEPAAAPADSSKLDSNDEQRRRADNTEVDAVDVAGGYTHGSRRGLASTAESDAAAVTVPSANGAWSSSGRWSTADGVEEPIDRREDVSSRFGVLNCALQTTESFSWHPL